MVTESVHVPRDTSPPRRLDLVLVARREAGRDYVRLVLDAPTAWESLPGQFLNILCQSDPRAAAASERRVLAWDEGGEWPVATGLELGRKKRPFVRRPLSISRVLRDGAGVRLEVLVRNVGSGTRFLAARPVGVAVDVVGPLGNHFTPPDDDRLCVLVGGGCGVAPIFGLADRLTEDGRRCLLILGAPTLDEVPAVFRGAPAVAGDAVTPCRSILDPDLGEVETILSTDDGSAGFHGTAIEAARRRLQDVGDKRPIAFYGCGPERMMRALARLAERRDAPCQVSLECFMGCGIGVCLSCAAKMRDPASEKGWTYRMTCLDGPVADARDVVWE
ncbi:MAG TPA: dihydroorotate dehydrogenase electron transfer subunit [Phycisphaerae bacterium]|nr:dihydroorotate dehydrogenase electron transfer subunit [Phycisphaerae bacterium]